MLTSRFVLFSDLHAHNFQFGSKYIACPDDLESKYPMLNSRLVDTIMTVREIRNYAHDNEIHTVFFGGDLFHERGRVDTELVSIITEELSKFSRHGIHLYLLTGNHDYADREGCVTIQDHLQYLPEVDILDPGWNHLDTGVSVYALPYDPDFPNNQFLANIEHAASAVEDSRLTMLLGHLGIQGATVGADYVMLSNKDVDFRDLHTELFGISLFGHFHKHQKLGRNAWYIGAAQQHNWGDCGDVRGFLDVEISSTRQPVVTQIPTVFASKFVKVQNKKDLKNVQGNVFIRVLTNGSKSDSLETAARELSSQVEVLEETVSENPELPKELFDPAKMITEWVRLHGDNDQELLSVGNAILQKVLGEKV